ncbi:MAG: 4-alpha-glucanotransferase [Bifidobacterium pseudocatenulatum]|uniref:4-alpha-glucanotransferase n=1 Tax=Bifidobacterium pseudocatenulatum TaxID=28026 RepID=A0AAX3IXJ5_BIFPS|nr:4-alpha-glucanotransferase [Bifidobacterium pseudocatenulatum]VUX64336.1 4-alpha-glucanotransferase [Bifidobacterium pseudocatenulatum]
MTEQTENATRLARPIIRLAKLVGIATSYVGMSRDYHEIEDDVLVAVLKALGIDASNDGAIEQSITTIQRERDTRIVPPTALHVVGKESKVEVHGGALDVPEASIMLEDGGAYAGKIELEGGGDTVVEVDGGFVCTSYLVLPADLPEGYHTLEVTVGGKTEIATVISAPEKIELLDDMKEGSLWGWMSQLYSIRSSGSWGIGDYEDLKTLLVESKKKTGADFMLINPLHAAEPVPPIEPSPYLPISRRFINFSYIRPESMPEYAVLSPEDKAKVDELHEQVKPLNGNARILDRETMWRTKMQALWIIYKSGLSAQRQAEFDQYLAEVGDEIESYATWCLCYDKWGASNGSDDDWVRKYNRDSEEVAQLRAQYPDTLEFYRWLEWVATEQLHAAQQAAREAGMKIGIVADMAVGVHPAGSDVWWNPERFAKGATVGAPPDMFNQQGQDWSQPPLNPIALEQTGYKVYRDMVHGMFSNAGAVRIDHILGLFRLWWIPEGKKAMDGTYVHYDSDIMLGILALEASRAGGVVVGEDLGVVPAYVSKSLSEHGILGCAVEWFEQFDGEFRAPKDWRPYALASVNTHDLPPAAGYLEYGHVKLREQLGLLSGPVEEFQKSAEAEHNAMLSMLVDEGYLDASALEDELANENEIIDALYRGLKGSPCKLMAASIVDAVGEKRTQNQPGTSNEYPNWRIPLADGDGNVVPLEQLFDNTRLQEIAAIMRG